MNSDLLKNVIVCIVIVALLLSGCVDQKQRVEPKTPLPTVTQDTITKKPAYEIVTLDVEPVIKYYLLGGYFGEGKEAFYTLPGDIDDVKKILETTLKDKSVPGTVFTEEESLNLVVFRGVFSTGGHGIGIDKVEKAGNTFIVYATYTDPGQGMMVTQAFTQPTAIIPMGKLPKGIYIAKLKVTSIVKEEGRDKTLEENKEHASIEFQVS